MQSSSASTDTFVIRSPETADEWEAYYTLRYRILRQPWGAPLGSERDEREHLAVHRIALDAGTGHIVGCGRIHQRDDGSAQIRFMAVADDYRGRGIGSLLLESLEQWAKQQSITHIVLYARTTAVRFYLQHGYRVLERAHTLYNAIEHVLMEKRLV
ncbi:MAG: GNAT family N-acetyltransferase [Chlorobi bacterium]|nr:GNAT family N-acetyltransferase [Chlorobiota bacterium]